MLDSNTSDNRFTKLEKQRELLRRKQKEKYAHQVLSLQALTDNAEPNVWNGNQKHHSKKGMVRLENAHDEILESLQAYAYDGPQTQELTNPDEISQNEVQVIRLASPRESVNGQPRTNRSMGHLRDCRNDSQSSEDTPQDSAVLTRSSTVISSLDQDALLLSASDEDENDGTIHELGKTLISPIPRDRITSPSSNSEELANTPELPPPAIRKLLSAPTHTQPTGRLIDWNADEASDVHSIRRRRTEDIAPDGDLSPSEPLTYSIDNRKNTKANGDQITGSILQLSVPNNKSKAEGPLRPKRISFQKEPILNFETDAISEERNAPSNNPPTLQLDPTENLEEFVVQPAPQGTIVRCRIVRDKHGVDRGIYPTYYLHMEQDERKYFLLAARRRKRSATSNYVISCDATNLSRDAESFAGKLRSNFLGTQFVVSAGGKRSRRSACPDPMRSARSRASIRSMESMCEFADESAWALNDSLRELAVIVYDTNVLGFKGPRKMTVLIPRMGENQQPVEFSNTSRTPNQNLLDSWKQKSLGDLMELHNKNPVWNEVNYIIMQFGRVAEDVFTMDFAYPMSALQAFGIALSSFDGKLACE